MKERLSVSNATVAMMVRRFSFIKYTLSIFMRSDECACTSEIRSKLTHTHTK